MDKIGMNQFVSYGKKTLKELAREGGFLHELRDSDDIDHSSDSNDDSEDEDDNDGDGDSDSHENASKPVAQPDTKAKAARPFSVQDLFSNKAF
ncbi:hypothetical protein SEUCBS140593_009741 [Sporothrix eucalyptigena]|uniref:Uncharacterized protein n=1 Tax=Sporothrix eucalyptigena TaxID=1812306 RepID=A0ABP0CXJ5_9PEZI